MDDIEEADVERLEKEIEEVLRNRGEGDFNNGKYSGIVNINKDMGSRGKSAATMNARG
jgi:hypothetical protein